MQADLTGFKQMTYACRLTALVLGLGASTLSVIWNPTDAVHHTTATSIVNIVIERALPGRHLAHS